MRTNAGDTYHNRYSPNRKHNKNSKQYKTLPKKCAKCGTTKGPFDIHHKDGKRKNKNRSDLIVLCRSCHRKLHDGKKSKAYTESHASQVFVTGDNIISIVDKPESTEALRQAIGDSEKINDLMLVEFKLCHEGINNNLDEFLLDEMEKSYETAKFKPINWEHTEKNIGVIYDSKLVADSNESEAKKEKPYIKCSSYIWKIKFPDEARKIHRRFEQKTLAFSMETLFKKATCSQCKETFDSPLDYCEHLGERFKTKTVSRQLRDFTFHGAGVVEDPADENATGDLVVAKKEKKKKKDNSGYGRALFSFILNIVKESKND